MALHSHPAPSTRNRRTHVTALASWLTTTSVSPDSAARGIGSCGTGTATSTHARRFAMSRSVTKYSAEKLLPFNFASKVASTTSPLAAVSRSGPAFQLRTPRRKHLAFNLPKCRQRRHPSQRPWPAPVRRRPQAPLRLSPLRPGPAGIFRRRRPRVQLIRRHPPILLPTQATRQSPQFLWLPT